MKLRKVNRRKLVVSDSLVLCKPTSDEISAIKSKLTFDNPAYRNAMKFSRYNRVSIPPSIMYYEQGKYEGEPCIKVPIGFDLASVVEDYSRLKIVDNRVYSKVEHSPFVLTLREDQAEAAERYLLRKDSKSLSSIVQLPTGKGKSILGLYIASQLSCKTLIVVHKDDLVTGWKKDIDLAFDKKVCPGLIKAKSRTVGHFITIATVQTLNRLSPEELEKLYDTFGLVIQDEMHHCPASSYSVVSKFSSRYRLGLTATPERTDGLDHIMNLYYGNICYKYEKSNDGKEDTDILPVKVIRRKSLIYFNPLFQDVGSEDRPIYKLIDEYAPEDVEMKQGYIRLSDIPYKHRPTLSYQAVDSFVVSNPSYMTMVCADIVFEFKKGHSCVVFFTQKESLELYFNHLVEIVGINNVTKYYGDCKTNDVSLTVAENKRKHITLTTYAKATEGTNVKQWEVEFLVSSINNEKNTEQAVGRIRRAKDGKLNPAILYDYRVPYVYSLSNHGSTRDKRYKQLGFISDEKEVKTNSLFKRGFDKYS